MSSLRNAVKRITHKERAQPSERKKFGLLEKHKDYVERAIDFKKKRKIIGSLKRKAAERNPDEFYFGMNNSQVRNGVHEKSENGHLDQETIALLKTQDLGYISYKKALDERKIEKLKESVHIIGDNMGKHKIFVNDTDELQSFDVTKHFGTLPELLDRSHNRPKIETLEKMASSNFTVSAPNSGKLNKELKERTKRAQKLSEAYNELSQQRSLTQKGSKKKVVVNKEINGKPREFVVYKWKRQRTR